jgi:ABC-type transporter Mla maintaining outer membrane lipid asymmetry permease subunit MlaE
MRKFGFLAIAALALAGAAGWVASTTQARIAAAPIGRQIDALQIMTVARDLPTEHVVDYSFVFEK